MENNASNNENQEKENKGRGLILILFVIIALLAAVSGYLFFELNALKKEKVELNNQKVAAEKDTDEYRNQLRDLTAKYDSLMQAHEGLRSELETERAKVIKLLSDYDALKKAGGSLSSPGGASLRTRLEELQQTYDESEGIILELKAKNQELTTENFKANKQLEETNLKNGKLTTENSKLNKTVEIAKRLKTYEVYADAVKVSGGGKKEKATEKASKANRLRVCFTVLDNQLADKQEKSVYAVIKDSNKKTFTTGDKSKITLLNGDEIPFSIKKEIFYDNKVMQLCLNWEVSQTEPLKPGKYTVEIYAEGVQIGQTDFELK
jgi:DNA repair exonuclease SbcCD ATPase subunit